MSQERLQHVANIAAGSLTVANYPRESSDGVAGERLRSMLCGPFLPWLVSLSEEMTKLSRQHVTEGAWPVHAVAQEAIEELAQK